MVDYILAILKDIPKEAIVLILGALPVSEVRGAIPVALALKMNILSSFFWAVLGNFLIVAPTLLLLEPVSQRLRNFKFWRRFFDWIFEKTKKKGDAIERYEALGLLIFVAMPLPMTGAWSGCIAASLFKIKFRYAFPAISLGVVLAAVIVLSVSLLAYSTASMLLR